MKVEFDNSHLAIYGEKFAEKFASSYAYYLNSDNTMQELNMSQVQICVTGTPEFILKKLEKVISEMKNGVDNENFNKPSQGVIVHNKGYVSEVITPVWNGKLDESALMPNISEIQK